MHIPDVVGIFPLTYPIISLYLTHESQKSAPNPPWSRSDPKEGPRRATPNIQRSAARRESTGKRRLERSKRYRPQSEKNRHIIIYIHVSVQIHKICTFYMILCKHTHIYYICMYTYMYVNLQLNTCMSVSDLIERIFTGFS